MFQLISYFGFVLLIHELLHYILALIFKAQPKLHLFGVEYSINVSYKQAIIINIGPSIIHLLLWKLQLGPDLFQFYNLVFCLNILPCFGDGHIIFEHPKLKNGVIKQNQ